MAFLRNFTNEIDSHSALDGRGQGLFGERLINLNTDPNEKEDAIRMDDPYRCRLEQDDTNKLQNGSVVDESTSMNIQNSQHYEKRSTSVAKWGSSFWKDFQPMNLREGSESGRDSKNIDSDYKSDEGFGGHNSPYGKDAKLESEDYKGQADVPADEMLSDDYYEQDGEELSDSVQYRDVNRSSASSSRPQQRTVMVTKTTMKAKSTKKVREYDDDDFADDDDDEDEVDEDDPDDEDFEPDYGDTNTYPPSKDMEWNNNYSGEEDDDDDDLEVSDDNVEYYTGKGRGKKHAKIGRSSNTAKEHKSFSTHSRPTKGRTFSEDEDSSADNVKCYSDDDFQGPPKKSSRQYKNKNSGSLMSSNLVGKVGEVRSSRRATQKVSYAESDESEEADDKKTAKWQKDDIEEDDGDSIEKVLWHQPKGMAEDALRNNKSVQPSLLVHMLDSEPDWSEMEFFIKWKGHSYLHCQWKPFSDLQNLSGFKKVVNYTKKVTEEKKFRRKLSREEVEVHDVSKEMDLDLIKLYSQVERIFADRIKERGSDDITPEYLVKWKGLSYAEATWERDVDILFAQDAIEEYKVREAAMTVQGKTVDLQRKKSKDSLRKLDEQPGWLKGGKLRDYQLEGLNFLVNSWRNDTNVILADEMGLGKTLQSVSMLGFLQNVQQIHGPFLVVVPLSTLPNWAKEFKKWLPDMNIIEYIGTAASREVCQQYEFYTNKKSGRSIKFNALLTTYEIVLRDKAVFSKIKWNYLMVDEAHRLKNSEASLYVTLLEFSTKNKLLITGTPLQNSVEELWALLHFLDSEKFRSKDDFAQRYKNLSSFNEIELGNLHKELRPHILRRVIKDVEKSLPPKFERILRVEMSPLQKQYYKWILERNFQDLNKGVRSKQVSLLNIVVELKKCCNHPFLFESADHGYGGDTNTNDSSKLERIILSSGKLVILDKLLTRLRQTNHRVLIFSQMVRMLDILADYLSFRGFQYQRLDGSTRADLRHQAMEHFNAPGSDDFCFLLSTRAGGLGINLATADTVIIFDSDWNPQNDLQAMSRAHRIGQQDIVNIYRFVTSKSVEEDILERAKKKMVLDHLVIQKLNAEGRLEKKETKKGSSMFDKNELSAILRFGAQELFKEDNNEEESKKKMLSMDIDEILERAEKVESKVAEAEQGSELLSAFKVANICSAEDDSTFWSRWIKPDTVAQAEENIAPRAARNKKSYAEDFQTEKSTKRKSKGYDSDERVQDRVAKRRKTDYLVHNPSMVEGAVAQVRGWSYGNLSKKDAGIFARAVKKFGNQTQISSIVSEVGGVIEGAPYHAQTELFNAFIDGCTQAVQGGNLDPKGTLLDFFGVPVKAFEVLDRIQELQLLAKRIKTYKDPVAQFRLLMNYKGPQWSKGCGWNQVDDARLLLGVHYHGFGNWEKIRSDPKLGLAQKIAESYLAQGQTFLPRAPNLDQRASQLLRKEFSAMGGKSKIKGSSKAPKIQGPTNIHFTNVFGRPPKPNPSANKGPPLKRQKVDPMAKEEGELSDSYENYKEEKWNEWCADMMIEEEKTLRCLEKLQHTSADLPKDKVLSRIRKYLQCIGRKIDEVVEEHSKSHKASKLSTRLWNYVSNFSNLSGTRLHQIYSKLKQEQPYRQAGLVASSYHNSSASPGSVFRDKTFKPSSFTHSDQNLTSVYQNELVRDQETSKSEAWKRRRRVDVQPSYQQPLSIDNSSIDPSSLGILGRAPADNRRIGSTRLNRALHKF